MSASLWTDVPDLTSAADTALNLAAGFWFVVAAAGHWIFAGYVIAFYGGSAVRGDLLAWNRVLPGGYVPGNPINNLVVAIHLFLAVIILVGGPLQLIPHVRRHAPSFHRWNGRLYALAILVISIAGLYMVWSRGRVGVVQLATSVHAVLIMSSAVLAVRYAIGRDLSAHRRWALRLFMVINAGWFFRIGLTRRIFFTDGFDSGTFLNVLSLADYLLPLVILEIYLRTRDRGSVGSRFAMAGGLSVLTVAMGFAIFMAATVLWLPRL